MSHALKPASGANTWMLCPGSTRQSKGVIDRGSAFAAEGSGAHYFGEQSLKTNAPVAVFIDSVHLETGTVCTEEMAAEVQKYVDAVQCHSGHRLIEVRLDLREWIPASVSDPVGGFGTADCVIITDTDVTVIDLKYGKGHKVIAKGSRQLRLYGLGGVRLAQAMGFEPITVTVKVAQPRLDHFDGYVYTVDELLAFGEEVKLAAAAADAPDAPLVPGEEQCLWCKGKATCPALVGELVATVPASPALFDDETSVLTPPSDLTPETLAAIYPKLKMLQSWIEACHEHVHALTTAGEMPGYKLIAGRKGNRAWTDAKAAEAMLKSMDIKVSDMYELKLISPTTAEKLAEAKVIGPRQWPKLQEFISRPDGKPSVVPLSDSREALILKAPVDAFNFEEQ